MKRFIACILSAALVFSVAPPVGASSNEAYAVFVAARNATHGDGVFSLNGDSIVELLETKDGKTNKNILYYSVAGYDLGAAETYLRFESRRLDNATRIPVSGPWSERTEIVLSSESVFIKTSNPQTDWVRQDVVAMIPKFVSLGAMDIFFMLELINSERLDIYSRYMTFGKDSIVGGKDCNTVRVDISREQYAVLSESLTNDVRGLLGPAADQMTELQLTIAQAFARNMLKTMDIDAGYVFHIEKSTSKILRVDMRVNMANPNGSRLPGVTSRIECSTKMSFINFGKEVQRKGPQPNA